MHAFSEHHRGDSCPSLEVVAWAAGHRMPCTNSSPMHRTRESCKDADRFGSSSSDSLWAWTDAKPQRLEPALIAVKAPGTSAHTVPGQVRNPSRTSRAVLPGGGIACRPAALTVLSANDHTFTVAEMGGPAPKTLSANNGSRKERNNAKGGCRRETTRLPKAAGSPDDACACFPLAAIIGYSA